MIWESSLIVYPLLMLRRRPATIYDGPYPPCRQCTQIIQYLLLLHYDYKINILLMPCPSSFYITLPSWRQLRETRTVGSPLCSYKSAALMWGHVRVPFCEQQGIIHVAVSTVGVLTLQKWMNNIGCCKRISKEALGPGLATVKGWLSFGI